MIESAELKALQRRHMRYLDQHEQKAIAGLYLGGSTLEMADAFKCSPATVRRVRNQAIAAVFDLIGIAGTAELLRLWAEQHWPCCTAGAHEMIENTQLLVGW